MKKNCWEVMQCGREQGGVRAVEMGVCMAAATVKTDGLNGGRNGGRICWAVSGTLCGGKAQGTFAEKLAGCMHCGFYQEVHREEGRNLKSVGAL